jgi:ABC-type transport system involved in cytochrome bd biosynthesis, fused ATPase and permease components
MHALRPYLRMIGAYRGRLLLGGLLMLATAASGIGLLALSGWFITATAVTGMLMAAGIAATLEIYIPGGGIRAFAVTRTAARYFERIFNHDSVLRLLRDLRAQVFAGLAALPPAAMGRFAVANYSIVSPPILTALMGFICAPSPRRWSRCSQCS